MKRRYIDITAVEFRNMGKDGNIDRGYWFEKTNEERLLAAATMIAVAFREPDFLKKRIDRSIFSSRKQVGKWIFGLTKQQQTSVKYNLRPSLLGYPLLQYQKNQNKEHL